jgi:hypothetical protein
VKADRVRYDHRTGDVLATGTVDTEIAGRRVRAEKLRYCAETGRLELANLLVEGLPAGAASALPYTKARGNGSGGVATPRPPCMPASSRLGVPWLAAATAEAAEDLSRIRGQDGVRLGAGSVAIDGSAFDLDPEARTLEVLEPDVRLRAPRARVEARKLKARIAGRDREGAAPGLRIALEGAVVASVELPFPLAHGRTSSVVARGERLKTRPRPRGGVDFTLEGSPARFAIQGAPFELAAGRFSGKIRGRHVVIEGELEGLLVLAASAFPERRAARRTWRILSARRVELAPQTTRPSWWFGASEPGRLPRRIVLEDVLVEGDSAPRPELVLFRPTWVKG